MEKDIKNAIIASIQSRNFKIDCDKSFIPSGVFSSNDGIKPIESAVLCLIYPFNDLLHVLLMQRNDYKGLHSGQICFPGGKKENGDQNLLHTAIRETTEETGCNLNEIQILGELSDIYIHVSNFLVKVYVAYSYQSLSFKPDTMEVKQLISIPLSDLSKIPIVSSVFFYKGRSITVKGYMYKGMYIWGATARMLCELIQHIGKLELEI